MKRLILICVIVFISFKLSYSSSFAIEDDISAIYLNAYDGVVITPDFEVYRSNTEDILLMIDIVSYQTDNRINSVDYVVRKQLKDSGSGVVLDFTVDEQSSYSITQGTADLRANLLGGITSGISDIYNLYRYDATINLASAATKATLMATSSYVGYVVSSYAESTLIRPIVTTTLGSQVGSSVTTVFGDVVGGTLVGSLFVLGVYATGYTDRHLTRNMMAKSVAGSSVLAGTTFLLGSSTITVGVFSLGTFVLPYLTAVGTYYLVDNFFQLADKVEEGERIEYMLKNIR